MANILVIDDNKEFLELINYLLASKGHSIKLLSDGHHVENTIETFCPDLILLDIIIGDLDGRNICNHLKYHSTFCSIPILMISSVYGVDYLKDIPYHAQGFITKPFELEEFYQKIDVNLMSKTH